MKKFLVFLCVIALIGVGIYFFRDRTPEYITNYPGDGKTIVAFGDSLVQGIGADDESKNFVALVSTQLKIPIINEGISGNTTRDGLKRIDKILEQDPKLVILLLGGNDAIKRIPRTETFQNLDTIIQRIHDSGSMVLLLGIQGGVISDPYDGEFKALAKKYNTAYVPNVLDGLITHPEFMSDGIHPNNAGYALIADRIRPTIQGLLR